MKLLKFVAGFIFACLCGLFVALAAGIQWGTPDAGAVAFTSIFVGGFIGGAVSEFS